MKDNKYVLITPAKNEEKLIEGTIASVVAQTVKPALWVIVDDGSEDSTPGIIEKHQNKHKFIKKVSLGRTRKRKFSSKAFAFNEGMKKIGDVKHDFIGNLDADVTFGTDYYENILKKFDADDRLGCAGGSIYELIRGRYVIQNNNSESVAGAIQLFRKECFDQIDGYQPMEFGGIDAAAEIMAKINGWQVASYKDIQVFHHRRVTNDAGKYFANWFKKGKMYCDLQYAASYFMMKCVYRVVDKPYVLGSIFMALGYLSQFKHRQKSRIYKYRSEIQKYQSNRIKEYIGLRG